MPEYKKYRKTQIAEMRPYEEGESTEWISISPEDLHAGSPKVGDMIARNPSHPDDQWLMSKKYFEDNYEEV